MAIQDANSINTFFSLLRSGLYGVPMPESELPETIDWKPIAALAKKQAVLGIIIDSIQFLPLNLRPSGSILAKMNKFALGLIQANLVLDNAVARLVAFLKKNGLNGVLLKGQGVSRYYRVPQMRQSGDVDFYVGKTIYNKAVDICKAELSDDKNAHDETEQHFDFFLGGIPIELHRLASRMYSPGKNKQFQNWIVDELEHSANRRILTLGDIDVTLPSYNFDAIFIFYHAWRHFIMGGIGLRQLCDWTMILHTHANDIDTAKLVENINRFGMTIGWKLFACIAVDHLGLPPDKMPLYDPAYSKKSEKILDEIISGGNFGYYSKDYLRTQGIGFGMRYGLIKLYNYTKYYFSLLPLTPIEATFLYFNRLFYGTIACTKRSMQKSND